MIPLNKCILKLQKLIQNKVIHIWASVGYYGNRNLEIPRFLLPIGDTEGSHEGLESLSR